MDSDNDSLHKIITKQLLLNDKTFLSHELKEHKGVERFAVEYANKIELSVVQLLIAIGGFFVALFPYVEVTKDDDFIFAAMLMILSFACGITILVQGINSYKKKAWKASVQKRYLILMESTETSTDQKQVTFNRYWDLEKENHPTPDIELLFLQALLLSLSIGKFFQLLT